MQVGALQLQTAKLNNASLTSKILLYEYKLVLKQKK